MKKLTRKLDPGIILQEGRLMPGVYEIVTQKIIKKLEEGTVPWRKPWNNYQAVNWQSQRPYRGINTMLLEQGEYATFKQISEADGKVKKGQKASLVVFWKWVVKEDKETEEKEEFPLLRYYNVFEINSQCEGLQSKRKEQEFQHNPIEEAEKIKEGYRDSPPISFGPGRAFYRPSTDIISIPPLKDYEKPEEYYSTMFHEMVHSTGHVKRLKRTGITELNSFGSEPYSKEELIAEMGAAMLCGITGIDNSTLDNSASYIASWLNKLKEDSRLVVIAAAQAQKAADYIQNIQHPDYRTEEQS